ncbi:MAG: Ldh family oxidoreductase [Desulfosarcinaceae bacterium]|nr:Ldh family oxidoreductase [Desulfosarcinaceae bacterium]
MGIAIAELERLLTAAAAKHVDDAAAVYFAKQTLRTHFKKAPRMNPLQEAVADLTCWQGQPGADIKTVVDKAGVVIYDGRGLAPSLKLKPIHDDLIRRARRHGMAAAGLINTAGIVTLGLWVDALAARDLIGIALFNGGAACCVPYGGRKGLFGTNPVAYAIPTSGAPLCLDMATTEIPFFDVRIAKEQGAALRHGVAVGPDGRPTTDAALAFGDDGVANLLPIGGGFKGYGIVLLIEVLSGALIGSLLSTAQQAGWHPQEYGGLILAMDIASFTDPTRFKTAVTDMADQIRALVPADKDAPVCVPGDRGHAKLAAALVKGEVAVAPDLLASLTALTQ